MGTLGGTLVYAHTYIYLVSLRTVTYCQRGPSGAAVLVACSERNSRNKLRLKLKVKLKLEPELILKLRPMNDSPQLNDSPN